MTKPTLSVGMGNFNHGRYLRTAIESVLSQEYQPIEFIIVDDASTDNSMEILEEYQERNTIVRILSNEHNMGVLYNSKKITDMISGDYYYEMAADDMVLPGFFEKAMNMLHRFPNAGLCSGLHRMMDAKGNDVGPFRSPIISSRAAFFSPEECQKLFLRYGTWISGNTAIYKVDAFLKTGGFLPELEFFTDSFTTLAISMFCGACFIPEYFSSFRISEEGFSQTMLRDSKKMVQLSNLVNDLACQQYAHVFPEKHARILTDGLLYSAGSGAWRNVNRQVDGFLTLATDHLLPRQRRMDRLFIGWIRTTQALQTLLIKAYLYWRLKSFGRFIRGRIRKLFL